jgi:hypothetical protein
MIPENLSELTAPVLRKLAAEHNVKGRSTMTKPALIEALSALRAMTEDAHRVRAVANVPEEAVRQAARDDETVTLEAIGHIPVSVMVAKPSVPELHAMTVGNAKHLSDVADYLDKLTLALDEFCVRAEGRYLKNGRKHFTSRQARRIKHKSNAMMRKVGISHA